MLKPTDFDTYPIVGSGQAGVVVYTMDSCSFCLKAKLLLDKSGIPYLECRVDDDMDARQWVVERTGGRKVYPQIFVGERHIGGFYELNKLARQGTLKLVLSR